MKNFKIALLLNLFLAFSSLFTFFNVIHDKPWKIICSSMAFIVFTSFVILVLMQQKKLNNN